MPDDLGIAQTGVRGRRLLQALPAEDDGAGAQAEAAAVRRRAFFGSIALGVVNTGRLALQMVVLPVVARLLGPGAFGLFSLAMPFILFANLLSDAGMGAALVRCAKPTRDIESTVFWLSVALGVGVCVCVWLGAAPAAQLLRQPSLTPILVALSPILILSSSLSVANARISRARHFALFAVGDLLSLLVSSGAAIVAALSGCGAWSLVIQQLALWTAKAAWVLPASGFRPVFVCRPALAGDLLSFGLNNVGANVADFLGKGAPALLIGGQLGVFAVGQYSMAYQLIRVPDLVLSGPLYLATFTAVAGLASAPGGAVELSMRTVRLMVSVLAPLFCGLALVADLLIALFLGYKWHGAAPVLAGLAPAGFFLCLYAVIGAVLMGLGRSDLQFRLSLACGVAMLVGVAVGARFGLEGATAGVAIGAASASPFYLATLRGQLRVGWIRMASDVAWPLAATGVMALAVLLARRELVGAGRLFALTACVFVGVAVFAAVLSATSRRQIEEDLRQIVPGAHPGAHEAEAELT